MEKQCFLCNSDLTGKVIITSHNNYEVEGKKEIKYGLCQKCSDKDLELRHKAILANSEETKLKIRTELRKEIQKEVLDGLSSRIGIKILRFFNLI